MKHLEIQEADSTLPMLLDEVTANQREIVITRNGIPVARTLPCEVKDAKHNYPLQGMPLGIAPDFDEPMPELWEALDE
jgi:antitoxin (DNA-binding transcriptional repressor) of toxin-antitoxin stability system